jgi:hypothetical protein
MGYVPAMSDEAVAAKTGKTWKQWFDWLDGKGAVKLKHSGIATLLREKQGVPGWWSQMVTVEYERARGLRERHQVSGGYSVSVTKTLAASVPQLYSATASAARRKRWFPRGAFELSSQTKDKYVRGAWRKDARLEFGFYSKGAGKAQIALGIRKLSDKADVEKERAAWKAALTKLERILQ